MIAIKARQSDLPPKEGRCHGSDRAGGAGIGLGVTSNAGGPGAPVFDIGKAA